MPYKQPPKGKGFKKGQSGNPKGRPIGAFSLTTAVKAYLLEHYKDGKTYGDKLKEAAVIRAITKSDVLLKEIWDRTDGKIPQGIAGDEDNPIRIEIDVKKALKKIYNDRT